MSNTKLILGGIVLFAVGTGMSIGGVFLLPEPPPLPIVQTQKRVGEPAKIAKAKSETPSVQAEPTPVVEEKPGTGQDVAAKTEKMVEEGDLILPDSHADAGDEEALPYEEVPSETVFEGPPEENGTHTTAIGDKIGELVDIENIPEPKIPLWRTNAVTLSDIPEGPQVAVVIDDAGIDRRRTKQIIDLPGPLTIAFLTYARRLDEQVKAASEAGHEILTHVPMQARNPKADPGKNALKTDLSSDDVKSRLEWALSRIPNHVGINNHMGSRFTSHDAGMKVVMRELRRRGLLFLDSRTSQKTVGAKFARLYQVPHAVRNVFLDHDPKLEVIKKQLGQLEKIAHKRGYAVAIGHPRDATIEALAQWLPILAEKGLGLVPISAIVARRNGIPQDQVKVAAE